MKNSLLNHNVEKSLQNIKYFSLNKISAFFQFSRRSFYNNPIKKSKNHPSLSKICNNSKRAAHFGERAKMSSLAMQMQFCPPLIEIETS